MKPLATLGDRMVATQLDDPDDDELRHDMYRLVFGGAAMAYMALFLQDERHPDLWPSFNAAFNFGNPNPDDAYTNATICGDGVYRISGFRGSVYILDLQAGGGGLYSRGEDRGPALRHYDFDELTIGSDGAFDVVLSAERPPGHVGDWWELPFQATYAIVRQRSYDWLSEVDARLAIERLDLPAVRPRLSPEDIAAKLRQMATWSQTWVTLTTNFVRKFRTDGLVNAVEVADLGALGGAHKSKQQYIQGIYELDDDEALVYETEIPDRCRYWNITVNDLNWSQIDYVNRQTSLNGHSATLDSDGRFRAVLAGSDPGVPNWLDTAGYRRGVIFGRWLEASSLPVPQLTKVKLADVRDALPSDTPAVSADERDAAIRLRRRGAQLRKRW